MRIIPEDEIAAYKLELNHETGVLTYDRGERRVVERIEITNSSDADKKIYRKLTDVTFHAGRFIFSWG